MTEEMKPILPPASRCCVCRRDHESIDGRRIVSGFGNALFYNILDPKDIDSYCETTEQNDGSRWYAFPVVHNPDDPQHSDSNRSFNKEVWVHLEQVGSIFSAKSLLNAKEDLRWGFNPWYCQRCCRQVCELCGFIKWYPGPCLVLDDEGKEYHFKVPFITESCLNFKCRANLELVSKSLSNPAELLGEYPLERRKAGQGPPLFWLESDGQYVDDFPWWVGGVQNTHYISTSFRRDGLQLYFVNTSGELLDYVWVREQEITRVQNTLSTNQESATYFMAVKSKDAIPLKLLRNNTRHLESIKITIRLGSRKLGPLRYEFQIPKLSPFKYQCALPREGEEFLDLKTLYFVLENNLLNYQILDKRLTPIEKEYFHGKYDKIPGVYSRIEPQQDVIAAIHQLKWDFDIYILSTSPDDNPLSRLEKKSWVNIHMGKSLRDRLIFADSAKIKKAHYTVSSELNCINKAYCGELIRLASKKFPDLNTLQKLLK